MRVESRFDGSVGTVTPTRAVPEHSPPPAPEPRDPGPRPVSVAPGRRIGTAEAIRGWLGGQVARTGLWCRRHRVSLVIVGALLVLVAVVHGVGMDANPAPIDD